MQGQRDIIMHAFTVENCCGIDTRGRLTLIYGAATPVKWRYEFAR